MQTNRYVNGFMFSEDRRHVLLIHKQHPEWQKGFWNGIGGKIEPGERPGDAMVREFAEETGILHDEWQFFTRLVGTDYDGNEYEVVFYRAFSDAVWSAQTQTDEEVRVWMADFLPRSLPNVKWLVPMALYSEPGRGMPYHIEEGVVDYARD